MTTQARAFHERAETKAGDETHRRRMLRVIQTYDAAVAPMKRAQFHDWQAARRLAQEIKDHALAHLPELLEQFERTATARGTKVLWAKDAAEARAHVMSLLQRRGARLVVKSKSMTTEEIELNETLEQNSIRTLETDLGELIVQLLGEKPYHIVTPAMHKTRQDISRLFHERLGSKETDDVEELTRIARAHLREAYVEADAGITGANFLIAEDGSIAITENEGNARLSTSCPRLHIAIVGIEKVLPKLEDLALFWPLLATSGTGQRLTCYSSVLRGPRREGEASGPEEMVVILLDNGRTRVYADPTLRETLRCIRCGACLNACPVFRTIGGHAYDTPYGGPIGSVITPHLRSFEQWQHLSFASSLCGACTSVCPVGIDLHHLLLENRFRSARTRAGWGGLGRLLSVWAWIMNSRRRVRWAARFGRRLQAWGSWPLPGSLRDAVPRLPKQSFSSWWEEEGHRDIEP